jgi:ABC-type transporter Mla subunit MlaD
MTNEEFERKMEFIVNQQAQFSAGMEELREAQAQTERRAAQLEQVVAETHQVVNRLAGVTLEGFKDTNAKIDALIDSHIRLSEAQARTDESLKNLIAVVDRYFERRNGRMDGEAPG